MRRGIVSVIFSAALAMPLAANAAMWTFGGALNANQEVRVFPEPPVNLPPNYLGGGTLKATLDDVTGDYSLIVEFTGLTGPAIAAHIHPGARGINGPVLIDLGSPVPAGFGFHQYIFNATFDAATVAMGTGNGTFLVGQDTGFYVNIHTGLNEGGELRGQIIVTQSPVPIPAAIWLMGSALLGVFGLRRQV